jgi:predicted dehydrogenase
MRGRGERCTSARTDLDSATLRRLNWRFLPGVARTKELIDEGFVGRMYHVNLTWGMERQADPNIPLLWRHQKEFAGFGVLGDIGPHVVDILRLACWAIFAKCRRIP